MMIKKIVTAYMIFCAKLKLKRTRPIIIGITGSFGKTTAKEALYNVLSTRYRVQRSQKSYNTELGMSLAILGLSSGFRSPLRWICILSTAPLRALFSRAIQYIILEYGADKPGDIESLIEIAKPNIGIITHIAQTHLANGQFQNTEAVFEEKKKLVESLSPRDIAILNGADPFLKKLGGSLRSETHWFNSKEIYATDIVNTRCGFEADIEIHIGGKKEVAHAKFNIPGSYHLDSLLPALLAGTICGIPLKNSVKALEKFSLPPGRMSIIEGIDGSTLLDSTYNASPETVKEALNLLKELPAKRKIAVLGNMNELGKQTRDAHEKLADGIGEWLALLITVGEHAALIGKRALKNGFPKDRIIILESAHAAGEFLKRHLRTDDLVLMKGSQNNVRLERTVKMIMKEPWRAKELLCRMGDE